MPSLDEHHSSSTTKLLLIGDSGTGKTGALASLAKAGYELFVLDIDNGLDILRDVLKSEPEARKRVHFETVTDEIKSKNNRPWITRAAAWADAMKVLSDWPGFGNPDTWDGNRVLVIDSLTMLSTGALRHVLNMNGRLNQAPQIQDWGMAMDLIESLLGMLYSDDTKCNVIVISHITYIEQEGQPAIGYPNTLGQKLPPKVGRFFNSCLNTRFHGAGRVIATDPKLTGSIGVKTSAPNSVKPTYPISTGLAEYFAAVRGEAPKP